MNTWLTLADQLWAQVQVNFRVSTIRPGDSEYVSFLP